MAINFALSHACKPDEKEPRWFAMLVKKMSGLNEDRATLNEKAQALDADLSKDIIDAALQKAFEAGMEIDEIMYVVMGHTERMVRRFIVQDQLKKAANKEKRNLDN